MSSSSRKATWSTTILPARVRPGDTIAVPAPAGPVLPEALARGIEVLRSRYRVVFDEAIHVRTGFLAGSDQRRIDELNGYLRDPEVRAIIPARGGYGLMRILEQLDADALKRDPKPVVGFSDATTLAAWCIRDAQVRPIHGPMVNQIGRLPASDVEWLFRTLEDPAPPATPLAGLTRIGARGGGTIDGRLAGGNLELITRLIGTPWSYDLGATLLVIEDVGERPYRIDRMLTQLKLTGALDGVRAVCAGQFLRCEEDDGSPPSVWEVIEERLSRFDLPGVAGLPVGHGDRNLAFSLGARAALDLGQGKLVIEEGAVG
jgi:muramoyltetrapeptide carboxypeptidase